MSYFLRPVILIGILFIFSANVSVYAQSNREKLIQAMAQLDDASNKRIYDQVLSARDIFQEIISEDDSLAVWAHYYAGAASSSMANLIYEKTVDLGRRELASQINMGIKHLEAAVEINPTFADAWVLLATSYAHKMIVRPLKFIGLRRNYYHALEKALDLEPNNPRVVILKAIMDYTLPAIAGGDKNRAEEEFKRALTILSEETISHPYLPKWGLDIAHARLGLIYMERGDLLSARESFEQAILANPDYAWVREDLIPSLEKLESES
ncbi:MAG: tetratricopeptide repeat protein [Bacteroidetes bacterium]|nr:tetratricopeptide repeat protein [Bacteroidota bacterium]